MQNIHLTQPMRLILHHRANGIRLPSLMSPGWRPAVSRLRRAGMLDEHNQITERGRAALANLEAKP